MSVGKLQYNIPCCRMSVICKKNTYFYHSCSFAVWECTLQLRQSQMKQLYTANSERVVVLYVMKFFSKYLYRWWHELANLLRLLRLHSSFLQIIKNFLPGRGCDFNSLVVVVLWRHYNIPYYMTLSHEDWELQNSRI